jgi:PHD/YefM family antitoxin component YafN of YafNO toxin-antitoxin module
MPGCLQPVCQVQLARPICRKPNGEPMQAGANRHKPIPSCTETGHPASALAGHTSGVRNEQRSDGDQLAAAAEEVEAGRGPVAVSRPGHKLVVLVSAEEWQRLDELESAEATAWWRRDAAERAGSGEEPGEGDEGPGLDEAEFRRRFAHLFHDVGAA